MTPTRRTRSRRGGAVLMTIAVAAFGAGAIGPARGAATCAAGTDGGEWPIYGHDLSNTRHQDAEDRIGPAEAAALEPAWVLDGAAAGVEGDFEHTPAVANGCIYLASTSGWVLSANADTGDVVWKTELEHAVAASPAVHDGRVFVSVNRSDAPYLVALDQHTGAELWRTTLDKQPGSDLFSSPVPFNGMVMVGVSGAGAESGTTATGNPQSRLHFRGSYLLLAQDTGRIIVKDHPIPDEDFHDFGGEHSGGGVWSTAAIDPETEYAYIGAGNPFTAAEHPNTNAILKIDVDADRPATFGTIVGSYHGNLDQYFDALTSKPVCEAYVDVFTCELMDYDFGASPQLFTDSTGRRLVGDLQKSGIYHAADRETMAGAWSTIAGAPFGMVGNHATGAFDGTSIFVAGSLPGTMHNLGPDDGATRWVAPIADGVHYQSVSSANGVAYVSDTKGHFLAFDAATGRLLLARMLGQDAGGSPGRGLQGSGVTIARHTVYVPASGGHLVAYR